MSVYLPSRPVLHRRRRAHRHRRARRPRPRRLPGARGAHRRAARRRRPRLRHPRGLGADALRRAGDDRRRVDHGDPHARRLDAHDVGGRVRSARVRPGLRLVGVAARAAGVRERGRAPHAARPGDVAARRDEPRGHVPRPVRRRRSPRTSAGSTPSTSSRSSSRGAAALVLFATVPAGRDDESRGSPVPRRRDPPRPPPRLPHRRPRRDVAAGAAPGAQRAAAAVGGQHRAQRADDRRAVRGLAGRRARSWSIPAAASWTAGGARPSRSRAW